MFDTQARELNFIPTGLALPVNLNENWFLTRK